MKSGHSSILASIGLAGLLMGCSSALGQTAPSLGQAANFAVLGGSTVTNSGATAIVGELGASPCATAISGFPPGTVTGGTHSNDGVAIQAQSDVTTAYNSLAGQAFNTDLTGQDLGGLTLTAGVYRFSSSAQLTGTLTLNAQGNANAVFIFQIGSTLTTASSSVVNLINGAQDCSVKIFWQVGSSATLGTGTAFAGNILAQASITLNTNAILSGRALAQTGAVTLDINNVSVCHGPASIDLLAFNAQRQSSSVKLSWSTGSEFGCGSFKILRSQMGKRIGELLDSIELSPDFIPCRGHAAGSAYEIEDRSARPDVSYSYFLRQYDLSGGQRKFGPLILKAGETRSSYFPK